MDRERRSYDTAESRWKLPDRPVPGSGHMGSFDWDAVRFPNGIFVQDDNRNRMECNRTKTP
jgi:hypothetical protein